MSDHTTYSSPGLITRYGTAIKDNVRNYAMYVALVVIFIFFQLATGGSFLSPANLANLVNQTGYIAVMAIGMTLILIIRHIDLSVGFVAGFVGAVAALLFLRGLPVYVVIPAVLLVGMLIGCYHGVLVAVVGVPAFVVTLAGMFIFRGLLLLTTSSTGSIIIENETFKALSQGFIPDVPLLSNWHFLTLVVAVIGVVWMVITQWNNRRKRHQYHFQVPSIASFIAVQVIVAAVIFALAFALASDRGIPWAAVIVGVVLYIYNFVLNKTRFGRYIYGIGGNPEAAELSGVNVKKVTFIVFVSCSTMAALGGILYTARIGTAATSAGNAFELDAIAACYIGGVSVTGGVGRVTNTIIGALVIQSLTSGMNLMSIDISLQYIVKGLVFILAVAFDVLNRRSK